MYVLLIFFSFHLYMSFREDIMGHETQLSTITNGIRFFKKNTAAANDAAGNPFRSAIAPGPNGFS